MSGYPNEKGLQGGQPGYPQQPPYPQQAYAQPSQQQYFTQPPAPAVGGSSYPGAVPGPPTEFVDPTVPRPNDILPLHPAIIHQRQIAASLPPCPKGGYHELRSRHALGVNAGTFMSIICFPLVCCCVRQETVCIKCQEKFNIALPGIN
ncbi:hypothetical protein BG015_002257 [Linnemannia schmuckeri]|uniref:Uncharacterized protein n=1 Tax=Linnemannia schmuckeri TaxID=64567 RepID=A0A9P5VDL4_9FUNG|nr:hypothetical protein BG015_002257 [Linnemannia schmuckeri]